MAADDRVVVIGGCGMDVQAVATPRAGDSVPGQISYSVGGVAHNIAENLARLGANVGLISAVGSDPFGEYVIRLTAKSGVDTSGIMVVPDQPTGCYISTVNDQGEMINAVSNIDVVSALSGRLDWAKPFIAKGRIVVIDCNLLPDTIASIVTCCDDDALLVADTVSSAKAPRLLPILSRINIVTPNNIEAQTLCSAYRRQTGSIGQHQKPSQSIENLSQLLCDSGVDDVIITLGQDGVYHRSETDRGYYQPISPRLSISASGAGDAFAAGVVYGHLNHYDERHTLGAGFAAAALTMESDSAVNERINSKTIDRLCSAY